MQDPYPATFQRRHHNISLGAVFFSLHINNNLSKAIISSDLFADYSSPTFVRWHYKTANTPYKAGLTYGQEGFALVFGSVSGWHTVISWLKGGRNMWAHYVSEGTDYGWSEYAQKSDLEKPGVIIGGALINTFKNESSKTVTKKISFSSSHCTAFLIIDQNCETDILSIGLDTKIKEISKNSAATYSFSNSVLTMDLQQWGNVIVISPYPVTIS